MARPYEEIYYRSDDGLRLYARDYYPAAGAAEDGETNILCLHGLTRSSIDFEPLIEHLPDQHRIISVDQRGRGLSDYDTNPDNYRVQQYVEDMFTLLDQLQLANPVLVGTSMGGLISMAMQVLRPGDYRGIVLNDIGPEIYQPGLDRIKAGVGKAPPVVDWSSAVAQLRESSEYVYPKYTDAQWHAFARRLYREDDSGRPVVNYDPAISQTMSGDDDTGDTDSADTQDLWPLFDATVSLPLLLIRGALTDLLHPDCVKEMQRRHSTMHFCEVPDVGHAPVLDEPAALAAIQGFIDSLK